MIEENFNSEFYRLHNQIRVTHQVNPLKVCKNLEKHAEIHASKLVQLINANGQPKHSIEGVSRPKNTGENIFIYRVPGDFEQGFSKEEVNHSQNSCVENQQNLKPAFTFQASFPINFWYHEKVNYNILDSESEIIQKMKVCNLGYFTQMIWKKSKYFGVGISQINNWIVVVCQYETRGNLENEFHKNCFEALPLENYSYEESLVEKFGHFIYKLVK